VNVYLRLWLTCLLLSAICCCRLCLFRVLLDACSYCILLYTALPAFSIVIFFFYLQFTWGLPLSPPPVELSTEQAAVTSFPLSKVAVWVPPLLPSQANLFFYSSPEGMPLPYSPELGLPALFPTCLFFFSCLFIIQFRGLCWSGPGLSVGLPHAA
jgi:hypothetical protein